MNTGLYIIEQMLRQVTVGRLLKTEQASGGVGFTVCLSDRKGHLIVAVDKDVAYEMIWVKPSLVVAVIGEGQGTEEFSQGLKRFVSKLGEVEE